MKKVNQRHRCGFTACALAVAIAAASVIAMPASAETAKPYVSPYTRAAMAQRTLAAHVSTASAPTAMQAAGRPSRAHAQAKRR